MLHYANHLHLYSFGFAEFVADIVVGSGYQRRNDRYPDVLSGDRFRPFVVVPAEDVEMVLDYNVDALQNCWFFYLCSNEMYWK